MTGQRPLAAYGWAVADRYGNDVLAGDWRRPKNGRTVEVDIEAGEVGLPAGRVLCAERAVIEDLGEDEDRAVAFGPEP